MSLPASIRRALGPIRDEVLDRTLQLARKRKFAELFERARAAGPVKVNLGSGGKPIDGWINCDVVWRAESFLDATKPWPVPAASVQFVYADNVIEHVTLEQGRAVFRHAYDAMAPGGVFRLATPDVEAVARQYLENGDLARLGMERNREKGRAFTHAVELLRQVYVGAQHYLGFCYDYAALSAEMETVGFQVKRERGGRSEHPELRDLDSRMHPAEEATELIVEGRRPPA